MRPWLGRSPLIEEGGYCKGCGDEGDPGLTNQGICTTTMPLLFPPILCPLVDGLEDDREHGMHALINQALEHHQGVMLRYVQNESVRDIRHGSVTVRNDRGGEADDGEDGGGV